MRYYAHNKSHFYTIDLNAKNKGNAYKMLFELLPCHGWNYDQEEIIELIKLSEVYISKNPTH